MLQRIFALVVAVFGVFACTAYRSSPGLPVGRRRRAGVVAAAALSATSSVDAVVAEANLAAPALVAGLVLDKSDAGDAIRAANRRSGGSAKLESASLVSASREGLRVSARVSKLARGPGLFGGAVPVSEDADVDVPWARVLDGPSLAALEASSDADDASFADLVRSRLVAAACALNLGGEAAKLSGAAPPRENLWLNNVPASRPTRAYFAETASKALCDALRRPTCASRLKLFVKPPELDDELDTYRVGTLLELTRSLALAMIRDLGVRVRVCVQAPAGTGTFAGLPLSLNGVRRLLEAMDWGEGSDALFQDEYLRFGAVGADDVDAKDDVFLILAPQSTVGCSVVDRLREMADAARPTQPIVLLNPKLKDVPSSQGVMGVRGREERINFANSFEEIFRFQTVVPTGRTFFPILGAVVKPSVADPYFVYQRSEQFKKQINKDDSDANDAEWQPVPDPRSGEPSPWPNSAAKAKAVTDGSLRETYDTIAAFADVPDTKAILSALRAVGAPTS